MSRTYFVGIDSGSQSAKVAVFDQHGAVVSSGRRQLRPNAMPAPGVVEHPDDDLWESIADASRQAMTGFDGDPDDIAGVGLCTIRFCRALLGADGTLVQPVMSWMDERLSRPYEHLDDSVRYVTTSSGYIGHRLTGAFTDTAANYQGMWPIDSDTWDWSADEKVVSQYGIASAMLFDLVMPGDALGAVTAAAARATGLPEGLPVVATANDKAVEALGCGLLSQDPQGQGEDTLLVSLGTYICAMTPAERNIGAATSFWTNFASTPGDYLYESTGIRRGMWTVSWLRDLLGGDTSATNESVEDRLNAGAATVPPGSDGLMTMLDWLAPADAPHKRGAFLGFDGRQGGFHLYRSVLEAIALTMYGRVTDMEAELGLHFQRTIISGGGSNSDVMMQIFADVFGAPAMRTKVSDAVALGSAICAAVHTGTYSSFDEAVDAMVGQPVVFDPDPANHEFYQKLHRLYRTIGTHTDELFKQHFELFG